MTTKRENPARKGRPKKAGLATLARRSSSSAKPRAANGSPNPPLIVGIGASAGGLNAFKIFFETMPPDSGMAFVLVQHLSPDHKSALVDLLGRVTAMPVIEADDGAPVAGDRIYIIPPNATLTIKDRALRVARPGPPRKRRRPIDTFFGSLAADQGENAVCIVLSGTGSDGALGLTSIKESGGLTLAQADFDRSAMSGMPQSAAATGFVDEVLPVEEMPAKLLQYRQHLLSVVGRIDGAGTRDDLSGHLGQICALMRAKLGHDLSKYKERTMMRRIQRRMQVLQIDTVPAYIARLEKEPLQLELLFRELLIGVTRFFRDSDAFAALQTEAIPSRLEAKGAEDQVRIWVPGCATGEEVYSIAILVKEAVERQEQAPNVQIFGTDIDENAVAFARSARYRNTVGVSPERVERWFAEDGEGFCPVKDIRDMCVFSTHSVVKDPPLSKLDLISCRNLLIDTEADLQERILGTFRYALKPNGVLFLGPSKGTTRLAKVFATLDKKHGIYRRLDADMGGPELSLPTAPFPAHGDPTEAQAMPRDEDRIDKIARRALEKYSPVYLVIDRDHRIVRFSGGEAARFLEPSSGVAGLNLFDVLRKSLRPIVRSALKAARAASDDVVRDAVPIRIDGQIRSVKVIVKPVPEGGGEAGLYVVAFQDAGAGSAAGKANAPTENAGIEALQHELRATRTQLQSTVGELETAKEALQSVNEELRTVNAEMVSKNELPTRANSELENLLDSTGIATIFLDNDLRIKSFTAGMTDIFLLRDADRGRPVSDITTLLSYPDLRKDARKVLRALSVVEKEVSLADHAMTFLMRIRPYRTVGNVIDGVVVTFVDITDRARRDRAARRLAAIVESSEDAIVGKDLDSIITSWNRGAQRLFGHTAEEAVGKPVTILIPPDRHDEESGILETIRRGEAVESYETVRRRKDGSLVEISLTVSPVRNAEGKIVGASKIARDITAQRKGEEALRESQAALAFTLESARVGDWDLNLINDTARRSLRHDQCFGYSEPIAEWGFEKFIRHVHAEDRARVERDFRAAIKELKDWHFECRVVWPDDSVHWIEAHGSLYRAADGKPSRMLGIVADITERKHAEQRRQLMIHELNHRVKNTLATVQSVAMQTFRNIQDIVSAREQFDSRVLALSKAHDILTQENWEGAPLRQIVDEAVTPHRAPERDRFEIEGPNVWLSPKHALALAMGLHELCTNAVKYGALSNDEGRVRIGWTVPETDGARRLRMHWTETDGPRVTPPKRHGFGSRLIKRGLSQDLGGDVRIDFATTGVICSIDAPLEQSDFRG